jgi:pimeloyl-ACP methyl ester carboxylesterase
MKPIETKLAQQNHTDVIRFSYASTRSSIADHATALREVLEELPENSEFSFVGHSMGNIVVRHLVGQLQRDGDPHHLLDRCRSMVMLGPPNQGAAIARNLAPTGLFGLVTGKGGLELGPNWDQFVKELGTPPFPFMIIAGDLSNNPIQNPLVGGSSDFVVSVEEAKLEGAQSLETVPVLHSFLMNDDKAVDMTVQFILSH